MRQLLFFLFATHAMLFGQDWHTVYLASFPRSGSHWVRFLVEEATHIATSSVYRDKEYPHEKERCPWGAYSTKRGYEGKCRRPKKADPILVKTHYPYLLLRTINPDSRVAICLVRHPIDSFYSLHVHNGGALETQINEEELRAFIRGWRSFYEFWRRRPDVVFIRYEDLQADTASCLNLILQTAGFSFDQIDIERAVAKYPSKGYVLKYINYYSDRYIQLIKDELSDLLNELNYDF